MHLDYCDCLTVETVSSNIWTLQIQFSNILNCLQKGNFYIYLSNKLTPEAWTSNIEKAVEQMEILK